MTRQIVHGLLALLFAWQAIVFLGPVVIGVVRGHTPSGDAGLGIATVAVGLACVAASAWCLSRSARPGTAR